MLLWPCAHHIPISLDDGGGECGEENHKMKPLACLQNTVIHVQGTLMTCSCTLPEKQIGLVLWNPRAVCWQQL